MAPGTVQQSAVASLALIAAGCLGGGEAEGETARGSRPPVDEGAPETVATASFALG